MQTHQLKRKTKRAKHVQRGRGGRRGKTSGRGHKGQRSRSGRKMRPEIRDRIKKLPKLRGRGVNLNKPVRTAVATVRLVDIDAAFSAGERITPQILLKKGMVRKTRGVMPRIKIVGASNDLTKKVEFKGVLLSESVRKVVGTDKVAPKKTTAASKNVAKK